ncbi:MAG: hypothetical protein WAX89_05340, partial [Alphaproteobacteria bacterium]
TMFAFTPTPTTAFVVTLHMQDRGQTWTAHLAFTQESPRNLSFAAFVQLGAPKVFTTTVEQLGMRAATSFTATYTREGISKLLANELQLTLNNFYIWHHHPQLHTTTFTLHFTQYAQGKEVYADDIHLYVPPTGGRFQGFVAKIMSDNPRLAAKA